jgi:hypothetical protein
MNVVVVISVVAFVLGLFVFIQSLHLMFITIPRMQKDVENIVEILKTEMKKRDLERIEAKRIHAR